MEKKTTQRRVYTNDFKAEVLALAEKKKKPLRPTATTPGITEYMLRRWMQASQEATGSTQHLFPVHKMQRLPA